MTEREQVLSRLRQVSARLHRRTMLLGALVGLSLTAGCAAVLLFAGKLTPIPHAGLIGAAFLAFGATAGALLAPRLSVRDAAIHADRAAGTEEILSTAIETDPAHPFGAATLARAAAIVKSRPAASMVAPGRTRPPWPLFAPIGPFPLLLVLPGLPAPARARETARISPEKLRRLEKDSKELKKLSVEIENRELAQLSQEMNRLVGEVKQGKLDKKEALAQLAKLAEKAEGIKKDLEAQQKALSELGKNPETKAMADAIARGDLEAAKKEAGDLAQQLADGKLSSEAKGALKDALSKASAGSKGSNNEKMGDAAGKASDALQKDDAGGFGEQMSKLAESMKGARAGKPKGGRSGQPSGSQGANEGDSGELDDATADLGDAQDELSNPGEGGSKSAKGNEPCDNCGRRKDAGGN